VRGCREWQRVGLAPPALVRDYTAAYRRENDPLADWIREACALVEEAYVPTSELYGSYRRWAEANGEPQVGQREFASALSLRGCRPDRIRGHRVWRGIALLEGEVVSR
jgi:putative DNA primase/helicase